MIVLFFLIMYSLIGMITFKVFDKAYECTPDHVEVHYLKMGVGDTPPIVVALFWIILLPFIAINKFIVNPLALKVEEFFDDFNK